MSDDLSNKTAGRPGLIERLLRWLRLADYHEAREDATQRIMLSGRGALVAPPQPSRHDRLARQVRERLGEEG